MPLFENNLSPYLTLVEGASPSNPAATGHRLYVDTADKLLKWRDSSGAVRQATGQPLGLTGAVSATRYVGGTASVAPTTGTFAVGDFVITQAGGIYVCTAAGTPGTWVAVSGGTGGAASLLAVHAYAPGADGAVGVTYSTTFVDLDATNAAVTFTAPASGNVLVRLTATTSGGVAATDYFWGLRESTTILGASANMGAENIGLPQTLSAAFYLTGISAGSHTWKWAHRVSNASNPCGLACGPTHGQLVMEVWGAP
jgi:hypothetical protein